MLATSKTAITGSDSSSPAENTVMRCARGRPAAGIHRIRSPPAATSKLRTRRSIISRWSVDGEEDQGREQVEEVGQHRGLPARVGVEDREREAHLHPDQGTGHVHRAANTMRITKPMAMPIRIRCAKIARPSPPPGGTCGIGGRTGSTAIATPSPIARRMRTDTPRLENTGAGANSPSRRREREHQRRQPGVRSWAAVTESMVAGEGREGGEEAQPIIAGIDSNSRRMKSVSRVIIHGPASTRVTKIATSLGHEGERHLVDLVAAWKDG